MGIINYRNKLIMAKTKELCQISNTSIRVKPEDINNVEKIEKKYADVEVKIPDDEMVWRLYDRLEIVRTSNKSVQKSFALFGKSCKFCQKR